METSEALAARPADPEGDTGPSAHAREKRDRFLRHAPRRTEKALRALDALERCANRGLYSFTDYEASQIADALRDRLDQLDRKFFPVATKRTAFALDLQDGEL